MEQQHAVVASEHLHGGQMDGSDAEQATRDRIAALAPWRLVPVALSALLEGLGQAYNRQKR